MKEKKNIDKLYQEKFKEFEVTPRPEIWKNIKNQLEDDKRKRLVTLPVWYKIAGVAAVLALIIAGSFFLHQHNYFGNKPGVVLEFDEIKPPVINTSIENETLTETGELIEKIIKNNRQKETSNKGLAPDNTGMASSGEESASKQTSEEIKLQEENNNANLSLAESSVSSEKNNQNLNSDKNSSSEIRIADNSEKQTETETDSLANAAIAELEDEVSKNLKEEGKELPKEQKSKLSLSTYAAPVVYSNFGNGNAIDPQFSANPSSSNLTMAYGINVAYQVGEKLKIRTGIGKVSMSYDIGDIMFTAALIPNAINTIDYSPEGNNFQIQGMGNRDSYSSSSETSFAPQNISRSRLGEINQQFGYIEIPLELEYKLIDKKLGLNLIGGGSSLILDENRLLLNANNQSATLGKANNINDLSFSTNIGVGINYSLNQSIQINLEPIFKYQINTFNNTQNLQPYYFGVYSGFSYRF